jgi:alpha-amylase/alpha-mannosidase (GH57 family)
MAPSPLSVVIHGHFYQPPREDPWLETLERQPSAAPYHDWNERIADECYRAVLAARVPGAGGRIAEIVNTLHFISFNFGPTLLEWMEANAPGTYRSILDADHMSRSLSGGHGNALAQAYHHSILPLASRREKVSEVRWGIQDFRRRFGRDPAGMWLPETAVDGETLDVLAQEGIAFTIVAPHQVAEVPAGGLPGTFRTPGGRSIALFVYDGPLSHGVAFGPFLRDAEAWAREITDPHIRRPQLQVEEGVGVQPAEGGPGGGVGVQPAGGGPGGGAGVQPADGGPGGGAGVQPADGGPGGGAGVQPADGGPGGGAGVQPADGGPGGGAGVEPADGGPGGSPDVHAPRDPSPRRFVSMATDGETFGHHHRFGEMALAAVVRRLQGLDGVRLENFASFLARTPPEEEVELVEPTSWSCVHGVERWRANCGCKMESTQATQQEWRWWLREAMDWLADEIHGIYEEEAPALLGEPWAARDKYGAVAAAGPEALQALVRRLAPRRLQPSEEVRARELLDLEHQALRLFTSCGWFFDDLARIEPLQILRYAARALELTGPRQAELEEGFLDRLEWALSNETPPRSGREIFLQEVKPRVPAPLRVAGGEALWELVGSGGPEADVGGADMLAERPGRPGPGVPGFHAARDDQGSLRITHERTARQWLVETRARRPTPARVEVEVRAAGEDGGFVALAMEEIPEGYRVPLRDALLKAVLQRWVPREVRDELAHGARSLGKVLEETLTSAVRSLGGEPEGSPDPTLDRVRDLADLHGLLELPIPFDAQTEFYRLLEKASPREAARLSVLREPLGFALVE